MPQDETWDHYMARGGQTTAPASSGNTQPADETWQNYLTRTNAPMVSPAQSGLNAGQNMVDVANKTGIPATGTDVLSAAKEAQGQATGSNLALARDEYNRQQNIIADQKKAINQSNISQGENPNAPQKLGAEILAKTADYAESLKAINSMDYYWHQAAGIDPNNPAQSNAPFFGGPAKGLVGDRTEKWSPEMVAFRESQKLGATSIANGILPYTAGADAKKAVMENLEDMAPGPRDTPQMAENKILQLKQKALNSAVAMRNAEWRPGVDTRSLDDTINVMKSDLDQYQQAYTKKFQPGNNGSVLSAEASALLRARSGQPQPSPSSSFSPNAPGMPGAPRPSPTPPPATPSVTPGLDNYENFGTR